MEIDNEAYVSPATPVGPELTVLFATLCGESALCGGTHLAFEQLMFNQFRKKPFAPLQDPHTWGTKAGPRPPGHWIFDGETEANRSARRPIALDLARSFLEVFDIFADIDYLERRRQALIRLHDRRANDAQAHAEDLVFPRGMLQQRWSQAADDDMLAVLPEFAGSIGYLKWAVDGFIAAHQRIEMVVPSGGVDRALAVLVMERSSKPTQLPIEVSAVLESDQASGIAESMISLREGFSGNRWSEETLRWLIRACIAGEVDTCRAWLDMAVRIAEILEGFPSRPADLTGTWIPVRGFQRHLHDIFSSRQVSNIFVRGPGNGATAPASDADSAISNR
jgi:hypothetical protein